MVGPNEMLVVVLESWAKSAAEALVIGSCLKPSHHLVNTVRRGGRWAFLPHLCVCWQLVFCWCFAGGAVKVVRQNIKSRSFC
jgi:hypothetical protein